MPAPSRGSRWVLPVLCLALLPQVIACQSTPGDKPIYRRTVEILVFEDANANGVHDSGEAGVPGVLVIVTHNIHGGFMHTTADTDQEGRAAVTVEYTDILDVGAVPPCGYRPTTEVKWYTDHERSVAFGFTPEAPRPGTSIVRFHLWWDADADGVQDTDEAGAADVTLRTDPRPAPYRDYASSWRDGLAVKTDGNGRGTLELGNSCGVLWVREPQRWPTTLTAPVAQRQPDREGLPDWLGFAYEPGTTEIEWGLSP